jgi:hypothetical protein
MSGSPYVENWKECAGIIVIDKCLFSYHFRDEISVFQCSFLENPAGVHYKDGNFFLSLFKVIERFIAEILVIS